MALTVSGDKHTHTHTTKNSTSISRCRQDIIRGGPRSRTIRFRAVQRNAVPRNRPVDSQIGVGESNTLCRQWSSNVYLPGVSLGYRISATVIRPGQEDCLKISTGSPTWGFLHDCHVCHTSIFLQNRFECSPM